MDDFELLPVVMATVMTLSTPSTRGTGAVVRDGQCETAMRT